MRKVVFLLSAVVILIFSLATNVGSQEETPTISPQPTEPPSKDFDSAYRNYLISMEEYQKAQQDYILKRSLFERFGTLKSRQDLIEATRLMLKEEDEVVTTYLQAVILRLDESIGIPSEKVNELKIRIQDEISWFNTHKENLTTAGSLEDLEDDSLEADARWKSATPIAYESLAHIPFGRVLDFSERVDEVFLEVRSKVDEIRGDVREGYSFSDRKMQILDRWVFQAEGKITRSDEKRIEAEGQLLQFAIRRSDALSLYNEVSSDFVESQIQMKEGMAYLKEVIREIKTAEE